MSVEVCAYLTRRSTHGAPHRYAARSTAFVRVYQLRICARARSRVGCHMQLSREQVTKALPITCKAVISHPDCGETAPEAAASASRAPAYQLRRRCSAGDMGRTASANLLFRYQKSRQQQQQRRRLRRALANSDSMLSLCQRRRRWKSRKVECIR